MTVTPWAGFIADFPDDQVEAGGGQMEVLGGRNVAVALGELLADLGCQVSAPDYAGLNGWEFDLYYQRHRFWCQVTSFHPAFCLLFDDPAITRGTRAKNAAAYAEIWRNLADALEKDPRFHDIEWRSKEDGPPYPENIGEAKARERATSIPPAPIEEQFRPEPVPRRGSGFGCFLMVAAAFVGVVGAVSTVGGVIDVIRGKPDAKFDLFFDVVVLCLSALGLWALVRAAGRQKPAAASGRPSKPVG